MARRILLITVAVLLAILGGWLWGASGTSALGRTLAASELRGDLLEGRAAVLEGRLDVYSVNFGEASRHLETARSAIRAARARLADLSRQDDVNRLDLALTRIDEAQRLAGQLNQDANARAGEAAKAIADVLGPASVK